MVADEILIMNHINTLLKANPLIYGTITINKIYRENSHKVEENYLQIQFDYIPSTMGHTGCTELFCSILIESFFKNEILAGRAIDELLVKLRADKEIGQGLTLLSLLRIGSVTEYDKNLYSAYARGEIK